MSDADHGCRTCPRGCRARRLRPAPLRDGTAPRRLPRTARPPPCLLAGGARRARLAGRPGFWAVTRHADVVRVLKDAGTFSSGVGATQIRDPDPADLPFIRRMMLNQDPAAAGAPGGGGADNDHGRLRRLVSRAFTPGRVERFEAQARERARALLESRARRRRGRRVRPGRRRHRRLRAAQPHRPARGAAGGPGAPAGVDRTRHRLPGPGRAAGPRPRRAAGQSPLTRDAGARCSRTPRSSPPTSASGPATTS